MTIIAVTKLNIDLGSISGIVCGLKNEQLLMLAFSLFYMSNLIYMIALIASNQSRGVYNHLRWNDGRQLPVMSWVWEQVCFLLPGYSVRPAAL